MKDKHFNEGYPIMKLDLHCCYSILCFFLITLSIYLFVLYECNSDDSTFDDKVEMLDPFAS